LTTWLSHAQTADVREAGTETSHPATDNAPNTGQYFESDGQVYVERVIILFCSKLVILSWSDLIAEQHWRPSGIGLAFGHFSCDKVSSASRRTHSKRDRQVGRDWPVYAK
jgi:hypothetical protein